MSTYYRFLYIALSLFYTSCNNYLDKNEPNIKPLLESNIAYIEDLKWIVYCLNWDIQLITIDANGKRNENYPALSLQLILSDIDIRQNGEIIYYFKFYDENLLVNQNVGKPLFLKIKYKNGNIEPLSNDLMTFDFTQDLLLLKREVSSLQDSIYFKFSKNPKIFNIWLSEKVKQNYSSILLK
jgi:hypothetical protein